MNSAITIAGGIFLISVIIATAAGIARFNGFYRRELATSGNRTLPLDGLRGTAALMVMVYHSSLFCTQFFTHQWGTIIFLQGSGSAAVIIFFMLTGYLFWDKARTANGKMNAWKFWRGRLYRIALLYLFSVFVIIVLMIGKTGGTNFTFENWEHFMSLLVLGAAKWLDFGNFNPGSIDAGVTWTLWFEWRFYLFLPLLVWFAVGRRFFLLALLAILAFGKWWFNEDLFLIFILGMLCPLLLEDRHLRLQLCHPAAAVLALLFAFAFISFVAYPILLPTVVMASGLFPLFLVAAAGNDFFHLLTYSAIRFLGMISYSLYLLHGVMFYVVVASLKMIGLTNLPQIYFWLLLAVTAAITTLICAITYRWIEFPFLSAKRNIIQSNAMPAPELQK